MPAEVWGAGSEPATLAIRRGKTTGSCPRETTVGCLLAEPVPPPNPAPPPQVAFRYRGFSVGWPCAVGNEALLASRAAGAWAGAGGTAWLVEADAGAAARRPSIPAHGKLP